MRALSPDEALMLMGSMYDESTTSEAPYQLVLCESLAERGCLTRVRGDGYTDYGRTDLGDLALRVHDAYLRGGVS